MNDTKEIRSLGDKLNDKYDASFVQRHIELPDDPTRIPRILGWSGPARSGTTALLFLLAGHNQVDRIYFQPQKTLMRFGHPSITINASDKLICMKEVFLSTGRKEAYDPIEVLIRAGIPPEKITWIMMLRDPTQTFCSWEKYIGVKQDPEVFYFWQSHTIALWRKYKDSKVKVVPFVYDLLRDQEELVLKKLLTKVDINSRSLQLDFNHDMINKKLVPGQAADKEYFNHALKGTIGRGRFVYRTNTYPVDATTAQQVRILCQEEYEQFSELAKGELGF